MTTPTATFLKHLLQTETFALSASGTVALGLWLGFDVPYADVAAFLLLGGAGVGGLGIALWTLTERQGYHWGWKGLLGALKKTDRYFWYGLLGHLPQAVVAVLIALTWRNRGKNSS